MRPGEELASMSVRESRRREAPQPWCVIRISDMSNRKIFSKKSIETGGRRNAT